MEKLFNLYSYSMLSLICATLLTMAYVSDAAAFDNTVEQFTVTKVEAEEVINHGTIFRIDIINNFGYSHRIDALVDSQLIKPKNCSFVSNLVRQNVQQLVIGNNIRLANGEYPYTYRPAGNIIYSNGTPQTKQFQTVCSI